MIDATKNFDQELNKERLLSWHAALFPTGKKGILVKSEQGGRSTNYILRFDERTT